MMCLTKEYFAAAGGKRLFTKPQPQNPKHNPSQRSRGYTCKSIRRKTIMFLWIIAVFSGLLFFTGVSLMVRNIPFCFKLLGSNLLLMSLILINTYVHLSGQMGDFPFLFRVTSPLGYLLGPTYYFFILSVTQRHFKFKVPHLLHLLPFLLHIVELFPFFLLPGEAKEALYEAYLKLPKSSVLSSQLGYFSFQAHNILKFMVGLGYSAAAYHIIWSIHKGQYASSAPVATKILSWIKLDNALRVLILLITFTIYLLFKDYPGSLLKLHYAIFSLGCVSSALLLIFFPEVLFPGFLTPAINQEDTGSSTWVPNSDFGIFPDAGLEESDFLESLRQGMEQIYTDKDANVQSLAKILHLSERSLYRKTKEITGKTPARALLDYRMEKTYELIQRDPEKPISQVAMEVGLVSNGNFSSTFYDRYGILPKKFQSNCKSRTEGSR